MLYKGTTSLAMNLARMRSSHVWPCCPPNAMLAATAAPVHRTLVLCLAAPGAFVDPLCEGMMSDDGVKINDPCVPAAQHEADFQVASW